jgi:hypothetical protein
LLHCCRGGAAAAAAPTTHPWQHAAARTGSPFSTAVPWSVRSPLSRRHRPSPQ